MPHSRLRPRIPANGRVAIRLTPAQRDLFQGSPEIPRALGQALHHAVVREGKLTLRVDRDAVLSLITVAAKVAVDGRRAESEIATLLRYLEAADDRFADEEENEGDPNSDPNSPV